MSRGSPLDPLVLLALAFLVPVGPVQGQVLSDAIESAASSALQVSPHLLGNRASLFFALPQLPPGPGLHICGRRGTNDGGLLAVIGDERWSATLASAPWTTEQIIGLAHRSGRMRVAIALGTLGSGRKLEYGLDGTIEKDEIDIREDHLLLGWGLERARWDVDLSVGVTADRSSEERRSRTFFHYKGRAEETLRPVATVHIGFHPGAVSGAFYAGYRERTLEQSWTSQLPGSWPERRVRLYGHHGFAGFGIARGIGRATTLRCALDYDALRTPALRLNPSSGVVLEDVYEWRATTVTLAGERELASERWGRPTLLLSVAARSQADLRWQKQTPGVVGPMSQRGRRSLGTFVRWGLSAHKWGFTGTASLANALLSFQNTLATFDLSAEF